jgi:glyoxylase-like metal-dependent hydrolase (beta-lactamase superfamily II)
VLEDRGVVFTGDSVGITYPAFPILIPTTPPTSFNLEEAVESLRLLGASAPKRLLTPHFGQVEDAVDSIEANIRSLCDWTDKVEAMRHDGLAVDSMIARLTNEIAGLGGGHSLASYAETAIRLSVLGAIRYLGFELGRSGG